MRRWLPLLIWLLAVPAGATEYFISPSGNNGNNGLTAGTAWRTWAHAINASRAWCGDTLTAVNGTYDADGTEGQLLISEVSCTAGDELTVRAQNERQAHLHSEGLINVMKIYQSEYIIIDGLQFSSDYNESGVANSVTGLRWVDHVTIKNCLFHHNNRWLNTHLLDGLGVNHSLFTDLEFYYFHRHGIALSFCDSSCGLGSGDVESNDNELRRIYAHNRGWDSVGGGHQNGCGTSCTGGDMVVSIYPGSRNLIENLIVEHASVFDIQNTWTADDNQFLGNIGHEANGAYLQYRNDAPIDFPNTEPMQNNIIRDLVLVDGPLNAGPYLRMASNVNTTVDHVTTIGGLHGVVCDRGLVPPTGHTLGCTMTNILAVDADDIGVGWATVTATIDHSNAFNNGQNYLPAQPHGTITNSTQIDPELGGCYLWIPAGSDMKGAGTSGSDIGATILYAYEGGVLTANKLWNTSTGAFNYCKAQVTGLNDHAGDSCFDVHERLHVNSGGCSFPAGYASRKFILRPR